MKKNNNREVFQQLRKEYPVLFYKSYQFSRSGNKLSFKFEFSLSDGIIFQPSSSISIPHFREVSQQVVENIVFQIGMIELVSYWKATCSPLIVVEAGFLSEEQCEWWKDLYYNGLGEFFYLNSIETDKEQFVEIKSTGKSFVPDHDLQMNDDYIVPIGGGKDSAVTLELLKRSGKKVHPLIMNPREATLDTVRVSGIDESEVITIDRKIDPVLLQLNERGFLNGHTPFSAMLAFYTLLASALTGYRHIALSNESSANEATIPGTGINHQYSKSLDFEAKFRDYYFKNISNQFNYFSFLRPLSELQIVSVFSKLDAYHPVFRSCNAGSKTNVWCGSCPKCLFTHIMMSAFRGVAYADRIIGAKMLEDAGNTGYFDELTGLADIKPFECVGTLDDVQTAMKIIIEGNTKGNKLPLLAERFRTFKETNALKQSMEVIDNGHFLDDEQLEILKAAL